MKELARRILARILPYWGIEFRLKPLAHIEPRDSHWVSTGEDPCFLLASFAGVFPSGWTVLDVALAAEPGTPLLPILYVDDGQGFREAMTFKLPQNRKGGGTHALIKLPACVRGLRFDPLASKGDFWLESVRARKVGKLELLVRIVWPRFWGLVKNPLEIPQVIGTWFQRLRDEGIGGVKNHLLGAHQARSSYADWIELHDSLAPSERRWVADRAKSSAVGGDPFCFLYAGDATAALPESGWIGVFAPGTRFPKHAEVALREWVSREPRAKFVYFDEDAIDDGGSRSVPFFKPDWNEEYQLEAGYLGGAWFAKAEVFKAAGGVKLLEKGVSDYQRTMAVLSRIPRAERETPGVVLHYPGILAHVPSDPGRPRVECLVSVDAEGDASAARDFVAASGLRGSVAPRPATGTLHFLPGLPNPAPKVSIVIGTRDRLQILRGVVQGLLEKTDYPDWEAIIVDNQSRESETLRYFDELQRKDARFRVVLYDHPFNFSAIQNFGVRSASGSIYAFLNNDLEMIRPDWLTIMVSHAARPDVGAVGARLLYANNTVQHGGVILGIGGVAGHLLKYVPRETLGVGKRCRVTQRLSSVTAACLVIRREVFDQVGGFDAENLPIAFNDVDFCLRVREAGYHNLLDPEAELYHLESVSRGSDDTPERRAGFQKEIAYMLQRWEKALRTDPAYNPNLSLIHEDFSLAFPPRIEKPWQSALAVGK